jgi:hypothetical protein
MHAYLLSFFHSQQNLWTRFSYFNNCSYPRLSTSPGSASIACEWLLSPAPRFDTILPLLQLVFGERDMAAIQLYLDHFQNLRCLPSSPHIARPHVADSKAPLTFGQPERDHQMDCILGSIKHYEYSQITGPFIALESAGWSRRTLLTFSVTRQNREVRTCPP